jgi:CDP-paratose 2-epimerase
MNILVTGSSGLIGSEVVEYYAGRGHQVVGVDNDMRAYFFGPDASTAWRRAQLMERYGSRFVPRALDVRDYEALRSLFGEWRFDLVVHTAAQPSHDWAAREPLTDFGVNANGTLNLLECARSACPEAPFVFTSTNKVYGDTPNGLPLEERETRYEIAPSHPFVNGIDETMSIDGTTHSLFGASKAAADLLVQEYGRYFGMPTGVFRGGCLTGPMHSGAELHGFLAYLGQCIVTGRRYRIFGYRGKQVRDNIHARDLVEAFECFRAAPRPGEFYNMGGGRVNNISMLEAIRAFEELAGLAAVVEYMETPRMGDHIWYVSSLRKFTSHYPGWTQRYRIPQILEEIVKTARDRLAAV